MPTYDYVCTACGHEVEVVHPLHGHGPATCSICGGAMKKAFAPPTVHFKGSGWARKERSGGTPAGKPKPAGAGEGHASGEASSGSAAEAKSSGDGA